jgi:ABC-type uncharacterized transport system permease subunit
MSTNVGLEGCMERSVESSVFVKKANRINDWCYWLFYAFVANLIGWFFLPISVEWKQTILIVLLMVAFGVKIVEARYLRRALHLPV